MQPRLSIKDEQEADSIVNQVQQFQESKLPSQIDSQKMKIQDLNLKSQKQLRQCITLLQQAYNQKLSAAFSELNTQIEQRPLYVMFEPLLKCNSLTDHEAPKNILPVYAPFIDDSLEQLRSVFDEQLPQIVFDQFLSILQTQLQHSNHQGNRIRDLEGELSQFQTQASIQAEIIKTLQQTIINEKQRFVKEISTLREQIVQKQRFGNKFQPDFNELPQAADCLNMPDISLDLEQFKQHSSKEIRIDNNKLLDEIKQLKAQVLLLHGQAVEGEGFKKRYLDSCRELEQAELKSEQAVQGYKDECQLLTKAKQATENEVSSLQNDCQQLKEQNSFFNNQIAQLESDIKEYQQKASSRGEFEQKYNEMLELVGKLEDLQLLKNNEVNQLRNQIDQLRSQIQKLQKQELKTQNQQADELLEKIENITIVNDRLKQEIDRLMIVNQELTENASIRQSLDLGGITLDKPLSRKKQTKSQEIQVPEFQTENEVDNQTNSNLNWNQSSSIRSNNINNGSIDLSQGNQLELTKRIEQFQMGLPWQPDEVDRVIEATFKQAEILRFVLKKESCKTLEMKKHMDYLQTKLGLDSQTKQIDNLQNLSNLKVKNASFRKGKKPQLISDDQERIQEDGSNTSKSNQSSRHSHRKGVEAQIKQNQIIQNQIEVNIPVLDSPEQQEQEVQFGIEQIKQESSTVQKTTIIPKKSFRRNQDLDKSLNNQNKIKTSGQSQKPAANVYSNQQLSADKDISKKLNQKEIVQKNSQYSSKQQANNKMKPSKLPNTPHESTKDSSSYINDIDAVLAQFTEKQLQILQQPLSQEQISKLTEKEREAMRILQQQNINQINIKEQEADQDQYNTSGEANSELLSDIQDDVQINQIQNETTSQPINSEKNTILKGKGTIEQQIKQVMENRKTEQQIGAENLSSTQSDSHQLKQEDLITDYNNQNIDIINQNQVEVIQNSQSQKQNIESNESVRKRNNIPPNNRLLPDDNLLSENVIISKENYDYGRQEPSANQLLPEQKMQIEENKINQLIQDGLVVPSNIDQYELDINPQEIIKNHKEDEINQNLALQIRTVASFADLKMQQGEKDYTDITEENSSDIYSQDDDITEGEASIQLKQLLKKQKDEIIKLKQEIDKEKSAVLQLTDIDSYNPNTVSLQQSNTQWKRQLKGNTFIMDKLLGDINLNDVQDVESVILQNLKQNDEKVSKTAKQQVLELLNTQLQDQLLNFVFDDEINEEDFKSKYQQNFLDSVYDNDFIQQLLDDNLMAFNQEVIQKAVYHPIMIKRVLQKFNELSDIQKLTIQNLYSKPFAEELTAHSLSKQNQELLIKIFYDQKLAQIVCLNPEIPTNFISNSKELTTRAKNFTPEGELNLFQFGQSIKSALMLQKQNKLHASLINKFQTLLGEEFYEKIHSGIPLSQESTNQLLEVVINQETMQKLMQANFDVKTTKKLQKLYDTQSLVNLKNKEITPQEARQIIDIFSDKQVAKVLFSDQSDTATTQIQAQVKQLQNIQKQEILKKKIVKNMEKTLFDTEIAENLLNGQITQDTADTILQILYNEDMAKIISNNKYSMVSAKLLSNVLYNPELAKALRNVNLMTEKQVQELGNAIYNNEIIDVLQKESKDQNSKDMAIKCARQAKIAEKERNKVDQKMVAKPFQVRFAVEKQNEKGVEKQMANSTSRHHMAAIQNTHNTLSGHIPIDQLVTAAKVSLKEVQEKQEVFLDKTSSQNVQQVQLSKLVTRDPIKNVPYITVPMNSAKHGIHRYNGQKNNYINGLNNAMKTIQFDIKTVPVNELMVRGAVNVVKKREIKGFTRPQQSIKQHPTIDMKGLLQVQNFAYNGPNQAISQYKKASEIQNKIDAQVKPIVKTGSTKRHSSIEKQDGCGVREQIIKKQISPMRDSQHQSKLLAPLDQFAGIDKQPKVLQRRQEDKKESLDKIIEQLSGSYIGDGKINLEGFSIKK
ncbi:hypothetical protein SS50377_22004 [Spironucleus salmonicida]|uniref:Uncharacterized protein n=1 Tax=Spironucleus salmonicida TaxID=348837 RepID=V6LQ39_9EUKA|nr:hypothetical protein SS50377_22004 [Spironucleus salmonicida]|eukprot:EST45831.1 hypothetical protein SS50377_14406 [Spironucleus salmonicida]